jgi:hypothetical protein
MNGPVFGVAKAVDALPLLQRTASANGDMFRSYWTLNDPQERIYRGFFKDAGVFVNQTAGSGNNPGVNQFTVKLQGRIDDTHGWADLSMTPIAITANGAAAYYALCTGPLLPELRVVATESGNADATFEVHVMLQSD